MTLVEQAAAADALLNLLVRLTRRPPTDSEIVTAIDTAIALSEELHRRAAAERPEPVLGAAVLPFIMRRPA